jgi:hypothetical protein
MRPACWRWRLAIANFAQNSIMSTSESKVTPMLLTFALGIARSAFLQLIWRKYSRSHAAGILSRGE